MIYQTHIVKKSILQFSRRTEYTHEHTTCTPTHTPAPLMPQVPTTSVIWKLFKITRRTTTKCLLQVWYENYLKSQEEQQQSAYYK